MSLKFMPVLFECLSSIVVSGGKTWNRSVLHKHTRMVYCATRDITDGRWDISGYIRSHFTIRTHRNLVSRLDQLLSFTGLKWHFHLVRLILHGDKYCFLHCVRIYGDL